jgi:tetratricopeptide (TPR) repeat protein
LCTESWRKAEDDLLALLASNTVVSPNGRTLAALGLVQAQIVARVDVRGALTVLLPILAEAERGVLPNAVAGRAHVVASMIFAAPDSRVFDLGRVNAHVAQADALLPPGADDLRIFAATSSVAAARFLGPDEALHAYEMQLPNLARAASPLGLLLADALAGLVATLRNDAQASALHGGRALEAAERMGHWGLVMGIVSDYAARLLRGSQTPEAVLSIVKHGRDCATRAGLPPVEAFVRLLAAECEALFRLGRFDEALAAGKEGLALAERGGLAKYSLTAPLAMLCLYTDRRDELRQLAESFERDAASSPHATAQAHANYLRAVIANLERDLEQAEALAESVCTLSDAAPGLEYVLLPAHLEVTLARLFRHDSQGASAGLKRGLALLERRPSIWYATLWRRVETLILVHSGRFAEARQRVESTFATFTLLGDVVQSTLDRASRAMIAQAVGAPGSEAALAEAMQRVAALGVSTDFLKARAQALTRPVLQSWREQTMTEKLLVALDRLGVKGLDADALRRELGAVLSELFPGRSAYLGSEAPEQVEAVRTSLAGAATWFGVEGPLDAEQRAALSLLGTFLEQRAGAEVAAFEPKPNVDGVLPAFIAASPATRQLKSEIVRLSRSSATILISGESGSGKEVAARAVHDVSLRADRPYVAFNCASVPRDLFESQLFGYRKGAFTGALSDSPGVIGAANGGTLFLDEIGELPLDVQPKLLRFLENGEIFPLGEQKPKRVDVRIVAASHRDLARLVSEGRFREDLYYRLNVVPLRVPPLRERKEDVTALARLFITRLAPDTNEVPTLGSDAIAALQLHSWPGNVRELRNVVERAMAYSPVPRVLSAQHLRLARA